MEINQQAQVRLARVDVLILFVNFRTSGLDTEATQMLEEVWRKNVEEGFVWICDSKQRVWGSWSQMEIGLHFKLTP